MQMSKNHGALKVYVSPPCQEGGGCGFHKVPTLCHMAGHPLCLLRWLSRCKSPSWQTGDPDDDMEDDGEDDGEEEDVLCFKYFTFQCIFSLWVIPNVQILGALSSERNLMMATVVWWAVCYSPADIVYSIATNKVSATMPGYRPGKVLQGTRAAGSRARAL